MRTLRSPLHLSLMNALRRTRVEQGLTQAVLAERMRRPQSFVAKVEVGERRLDVVEFIEYAKALGVAPEDLMRAMLIGA